jgi:hypothetical protein
MSTEPIDFERVPPAKDDHDGVPGTHVNGADPHDDDWHPVPPPEHEDEPSGCKEPIDTQAQPSESPPAGRTTKGRLEIAYHAGDYGPQVRSVLQELGAIRAVYVNGPRLVSVVRVSTKEQERSSWTDSAGRKRYGFLAGSPQIATLGRAAAKLVISDACAFYKYVIKRGGWVPCPPPDDIAGAVFDGPWPGLPRLVGITEIPILRPDGSLLQTPGYDPLTGYWYEPRCSFPEVPEAPTKADADAAYAELVEVFSEFPYVDADMRAIPVAAALTVAARAYLVNEAVPGFVFDASAGGTGKTLQTDCIATITSGRAASRKAYPASDEECEKVLAAYAMRGAALISIDDIKRALGGENLDRVITARNEVDFRKLGETRLITTPWRAVLMFTGVNVAFFGQMARRVLVARIESPLERPQDRTDWKHPKLVEWVTEERPRLVVATLTLLRSYIVHGSPDIACGARWGSFEGWSALIPNAIRFAGGPDVLRFRAPEDADVERESLGAILAGLRALVLAGAPIRGRDPSQGMTAGEIVDDLFRTWDDTSDPSGLMRGVASEFRAATHSKGSAPSAQQVARVLSKHKGRPVSVGRDLLTLRRQDAVGHENARLWSVEVRP